jgi:S1-C subfamily serine protease
VFIIYKSNDKRKINFGKKFLILGTIVAIFVLGFSIGSSTIYGLLESEMSDLESQINDLEYQFIKEKSSVKNFTEYSYYFNESSLASIYNEVKDSIVVISAISSYKTFFDEFEYEVQGSGFIYEFDGECVIITNNHVVSDVSDIVITFSNGNSYPGDLIGSDAYSDLAVLSVEALPEELKPLEIKCSQSLKVGEPVIAVGNPRGLDNTMTTGIISQTGRTIKESDTGGFLIADVIQTDVAINPGNSGGALLNYNGEVIGITTAIIQDSEGLGFSIPSNTILKEIPDLVKNGLYINHSYLGVSGADMSYSIAKAMNVDMTYGWLVVDVEENSPADKADLQKGDELVEINDKNMVVGGDIIISIDGDRIVDGDALLSYLERYTKPDQLITLTVIRDNEQIDVEVELGRRPKQ